ncbi:MAG: ABC transporter permease [Eubacteriales bacterium]|nr:ABC transporter permease [Eubacteriales bacterium]
MKLWLGFTAMLKKEIILMRRYFVNSIGGIITIYFIFMLIFWGYTGIGTPGLQMGTTVENIVVGYVTWLMLMMAWQTIPYSLLQETQEGTLEQLCMSPLGLTALSGFKVVANAITDMLIVIAMLVLTMATTGTSLNIDIISLLPLMLFALMAVSGLGFFFGGITLMYKRIQSYLQIVQFALIALVAADPSPVFRWLPATLPSHWLRMVMIKGQNLSHIPGRDWLTMLLSSLLYLLVGIAVFKLCEAKARRQGTLGHF